MCNSEQGAKLGRSLCERIKAGTFKKDFLTNHGDDFTGGQEELVLWQFNRYISSCAYYLLKKHQDERGVLYEG